MRHAFVLVLAIVLWLVWCKWRSRKPRLRSRVALALCMRAHAVAARGRAADPIEPAICRRPCPLTVSREWLQHHRAMGVSHFYISLEDSPAMVDYLRSQPDVEVEVVSAAADGSPCPAGPVRAPRVPSHPDGPPEGLCRPLSPARPTQSGKEQPLFPTAGGTWTGSFTSTPTARRPGPACAADELLHGNLSVLDACGRQPRLPPGAAGPDPDVRAARERGGGVQPRDGGLFRVAPLPAMFSGHRSVLVGGVWDRAPCRAYVNGKGGGRVVPGVTLAGPHHFAHEGQWSRPPLGSVGAAREGPHVASLPFESLCVLHFSHTAAPRRGLPATRARSGPGRKSSCASGPAGPLPSRRRPLLAGGPDRRTTKRAWAP
jgi:hypothetical protein